MSDRNTQGDPLLSEFIEVVEALTKDFAGHADFPKFRIPSRPVPLDAISAHAGLDPGNDPHGISRRLFTLEWDSFPGYSSDWHLFAFRLPLGERVYWVDDANGRRIIAVGPGGVGADRRFARALLKDNGESFGTGVLDSAPSRVSTNLRGDFLISAFLDAFSCSANAWDSIDGFGPIAIRKWLKKTLTKGGKELSTLTRDQLQQEFLARVAGLISDFHPHPEEKQVGVRPFTSSGEHPPTFATDQPLDQSDSNDVATQPISFRNAQHIAPLQGAYRLQQARSIFNVLRPAQACVLINAGDQQSLTVSSLLDRSALSVESKPTLRLLVGADAKVSDGACRSIPHLTPPSALASSHSSSHSCLKRITPFGLFVSLAWRRPSVLQNS